jgi:tetratricopeptide (TPR) repeat protein
MDEVLLPGWRKHLEEAHKVGATRPRYQYTWNWQDEAHTIPGLQYGGDKIHSRFGYMWKHPVHEVIRGYGDMQEIQHWVGLEIHHHADSSKPRSQYLPLLKQAVQEDSHDDRNAFYYARELYFYGHREEAIAEFKRHLALPNAVWPPERAASMRYLAKLETDKVEEWLGRAIAQSPGRRESLVELAMHHYGLGNWASCQKAATKALEIKEKPLDYLCEDFAWGALPWDLSAISAYKLGDFKRAVEHNKEALKLDPRDERLQANAKYYLEALKAS